MAALASRRPARLGGAFCVLALVWAAPLKAQEAEVEAGAVVEAPEDLEEAPALPPQVEADPVATLRAVEVFEAAAGDSHCIRALDWIDEEDLAPRIYALPPHPETGERDLLFQFLCNRAAYNETHVFIAGKADGSRFDLLQFPAPLVDVDYENDDFEGAVLGVRIVGLQLKREIVNAAFDPETAEISEFSRWRGISDASSSAVWRYVDDPETSFDGGYELKEYQLDASYDGEANPQRLIPPPEAEAP
ncbi:hypothetical protein [Neomegalonema sp.]|uniref:DUF1176 domain-containing protein n=1 Tax=Neomegalonema sp. TaxID=2039713 RepID=UPI002635B284|nr:hypothetical protein [Neomegalonema sp.]MDD2868030.1 hypothetical protein [Neomegalonema sp.]